ncbi:MAG: response regulator transcription factor [Microbacterium sp.]|jgi:DNA-binding NarL/FixJ family response regulator|uniref:helix-turn-helix transcriptional regulator n=1 Tax=Microbacterium sp. TaxID=51671 RepID=UPI0026008655|nr:LuxR C-terminal-related transcriptional regulator [Microbacterium sp.]MBQ9918249.1 response regulator transcription factor [Microbacterium sp.]
MSLSEPMDPHASPSGATHTDLRDVVVASRHLFALRHEPDRIPAAVIATLARTPTSVIARLSGAERWYAAAAIAGARASAASYDAAASALAAVAWETLSTHAGIDPRARAWGWLIVAEISLAGGSLRRALNAAENARVALGEHPDEIMQQEAGALAALARALNGESAHARRFIEGASPGPAARVERLVAYTRAVLAAAEADAWVLSDCAETLRRRSPVDDTAEAAATLMAALAHLLDGRVDEASAKATSILHATAYDRFPPVLRALAATLTARTLIARGDHLRALTVLHERSSPAGHVVCLESVRASAYLGIGWWRECLRATDGCLRMGHQHALRTLTSVSLNRAVALHRLGHAQAADAMFADGVHTALSTGAIVDLLLLPPGETDTLFSRAGEAAAGLSQRVREARTFTPAPRRAARAIPAFSPREEVLARALLAGTTMREIAIELHVSVNTIKTQTRAVYRKAGVRSRTELILLLDDIGFGGAARPS